ncbi:MAG: hypothetical protein D3908_09620 [Candidatus Electrothrix sp. AUS4]|nr:hypothetical protein [Candidatus Electrothrix sp. AUS4]
MKRDSTLRYSQTSKIRPGAIKFNRTLVIFFLIAGIFSSAQGVEVPKQPQASATRYRPSKNLYATFERIVRKASAGSGTEVLKQSQAPAEHYRPTEDPPDKIGQIIQDTATRVQQSGVMNSSTCGRPWKLPLTTIQGKIHNVEYREQPFTKRSGLHLDVETGPQTYTVIHVYPERLTALCPSVFHFRVGDTLTVTGSEFFTGQGGMQQNICAATITQGKAGENVLGMRDPQTGALERQLCCQQICEKNCIGLPPVCGQICAMNCEKRLMKTVLQTLPFNPSQDKQYRTATY